MTLRRQIQLAIGALSLIIIASVIYWRSRPNRHARTLHPLPQFHTDFQNAHPGIEYVGSQACVECHQEIHEAYFATQHSQGFRNANTETDGHAGAIAHNLSGRTYVSAAAGDGIHHQEWLKQDDADAVLLSDYSVRYVVGSGNHAQAFLVEKNGFLTESPITWYTLEKCWGMSPGYDQPVHRGFERPVLRDCLFCHAGRVENVDGATNKLKVLESSISCERCHGPGSLHVQTQNVGENEDSQRMDSTIVNPRRLTRERQEDVCAQCHFSTVSEVEVRSRSRFDYRPSLRLQDYVVHYGVEDSDAQMTVAGHVEQLRQSPCYRQSSSMTCTTCHDPHHAVPPVDRVDHFRGKCLACHQEDACGLSLGERASQHAVSANDCAGCHMPRVSTEVIHVASTQHRIGIPRAAQEFAQKSTARAKLQPLTDVSHLAASDQERCLGLAYLEYAQDKSDSLESYRGLLSDAKAQLDKARELGLQEGSLEAALARVQFELGDQPAARSHLARALADEDLPIASRDAVYWLQLQLAVQDREMKSAVSTLEQMVRFSPNSTNCIALAETYRQLGRKAEAITLARQAVTLNGSRMDARRMLMMLLLQTGDNAKGREQQEIIQLLEHSLPEGSP